MADATFEELLDCLADRKGRRVFIEVGRKDPRKEDADFAVLGVHTTLGAVLMVGDP